MAKYTDVQRREAIAATRHAVACRPIDWHATDRAMQRLFQVAGVSPSDLAGLVSTRSLMAWFPSWKDTKSQRHMPVVYFIATHDHQHVKIGTTTRIISRLSQIQTSHPQDVTLLGITLGSRNTEQEWHDRWRPLHVRGEWYRLTTELRDAIANLEPVSDLMDTVNPKGD